MLLFKNQTKNGVEKIDPTTPLYFGKEGRKGGPTQVIYGFEDSFKAKFPEPIEKYKTYEEHPLFNALNVVHNQFLKEVIYDSDIKIGHCDCSA